MNAAQLAHNAYAPGNASLRSARGTEYDAFVRITQEIKSARTPGAVATALHRNRALWTILATDVADPENGLPAPLRAQIFYLAEFTNHHTSRVLAGSAQVDVLIEVNTAVMRGLSQRPVVS